MDQLWKDFWRIAWVMSQAVVVALLIRAANLGVDAAWASLASPIVNVAAIGALVLLPEARRSTRTLAFLGVLFVGFAASGWIFGAAVFGSGRFMGQETTPSHEASNEFLGWVSFAIILAALMTTLIAGLTSRGDSSPDARRQ